MRPQTNHGTFRSKVLTLLIALAATLFLVSAFGTADAQAVITVPIPGDAGPGPPPIPVLPPAGDTPPPAEQIADPVTPTAACSDWSRQGSYAGRWSAGSSWWEFSCESSEYHSYDPCAGGGGACNACCAWWETTDWTDYFYWDGTQAVFYGESYFDSTDGSWFVTTSYWWDAPTARWYNLGPLPLTVSTQGSGSGSVNSNPVGIDCPGICDASFDAGISVTLTATPDAGSIFTGWSGDCSGTGTCQVSADQARSVTATFAPRIATLTVAKAGTGSGAITSSPTGISCGTSCQASFDGGSSVTLSATPDALSIFTGWSGACSGTGSCQVTLDQARSVTATFVRRTATLSVAKAGTGYGAVTSSPTGISCGAGCQASFDTGTSVALTASPDAGSLFTGWSGACSGMGICQVTMDQARSVAATFALNAPPHASFNLTCTGLTCSFDGSGSSDPEGSSLIYAWAFGDSGSGSGQTITHTYARAGRYTATLTVTDNGGATASDSKTFNPMSVSARGYRQNGQKVDLTWDGPSGSGYDVYRDGAVIATVQAGTYTDNLGSRGHGTVTYKVCASAGSVCTNTASVTF